MSERTKRFYISNKDESVPMFESKFMEFFSHVHPATPLILYVPVVVYMLYRALVQENMSILRAQLQCKIFGSTRSELY